jgi:DNA-binding HxlR family transcriptional regulator
MLSAYIMNLASKLWGKKWRTVTIWNLRDGPLRFSQLKALVPTCSVKVLSEVLRELERNKLIVRKQYEGIPVKVTYELHPDTVPLIDAQRVYHKALITYFLKHAKRFELPKEIIKELESSLLIVLYVTIG